MGDVVVMEWEGLYDKAVQIATRAHAGQHDKAGEDYILHPMRVANRCVTPKGKIVALNVSRTLTHPIIASSAATCLRA